MDYHSRNKSNSSQSVHVLISLLVLFHLVYTFLSPIYKDMYTSPELLREPLHFTISFEKNTVEYTHTHTLLGAALEMKFMCSYLHILRLQTLNDYVLWERDI